MNRKIRVNNLLVRLNVKNEISEKKLRCLTLWWNVITVQISPDFNFVFHQVLLALLNGCSGAPQHTDYRLSTEA